MDDLGRRWSCISGPLEVGQHGVTVVLVMSGRLAVATSETAYVFPLPTDIPADREKQAGLPNITSADSPFDNHLTTAGECIHPNTAFKEEAERRSSTPGTPATRLVLPGSPRSVFSANHSSCFCAFDQS